jgi:hypothetical protein
MVSNLFSEALGYIFLAVGVGLIWYRFDWMIALLVGLLIYGLFLILGGYILSVTEHLEKRLNKKFED